MCAHLTKIMAESRLHEVTLGRVKRLPTALQQPPNRLVTNRAVESKHLCFRPKWKGLIFPSWRATVRSLAAFVTCRFFRDVLIHSLLLQRRSALLLFPKTTAGQVS